MITAQELGLHLIARYLLLPDYLKPPGEKIVEKLTYGYGVDRIYNLSQTSGSYITWSVSVCCGCYTVQKFRSSSLCTATCGTCDDGNSAISYHTATLVEHLNRDISFITYPNKLILQDLVYQHYLNKLLS